MHHHVSGIRATITGFVAGFLAVPFFHQLAQGALYALNIIPIAPFNMTPVPPLGIPLVLSASFWGGIWGIIFAFTLLRLRGSAYWIWNIIGGAVLLSVVAALIVAPLKHKGIMWDYSIPIMLFALYVNAFWGLGTALIFKLLNR